MINKRETKPALKWGYSPARQTDTSAKQLSVQMGTNGENTKTSLEQKLGECSRAFCQQQRMALAAQISEREHQKRQSWEPAQVNAPGGRAKAAAQGNNHSTGEPRTRTYQQGGHANESVRGRHSDNPS